MMLYVSYDGFCILFVDYASIKLSYASASIVSRYFGLGYTVANESGMLISW